MAMVATAKEVTATLERTLLVASQPDVRLMDYFGGVQRARGPSLDVAVGRAQAV